MEQLNMGNLNLILKNKFWNHLQYVKYHELYIDLCAQDYKRRDTWIEVFLLCTSSSSIAAWVFWKEYALFWSGLIAISQVIQVIKPHIFFITQHKAFSNMYFEFSVMYIDADRMFNLYLNKEITDDRLHEYLHVDKKKLISILQTNISDGILPIDAKRSKIVQAKVDSFFNIDREIYEQLKQ